MKKRRIRLNCRTEGCGASFNDMGELRKHKKKHASEKEISEANLATSLIMDKGRLNSELLRASADLQIANRTLDIIKLLLEPIKFSIGVQVVRSAVADTEATPQS